VAEFKDEQVESFVRNWFRASGQTKEVIEQQWQAFSDATEHNSALKELTVTPVLLSLVCWVFQDSEELPSQAALLYREGIRLLLEKWNDRKEIDEWEIGKEVYRELSIDQKEALLIEIAARKFENPGNFVLFEQRDLAEQIANFLKLTNAREGEAVLKAIEAQHGLLVERADELWSFSHFTFQEYFTIQWLTKLSPEQLAKKIANSQWQEVVKQLVKSQPADRLLQLIKRVIDYSVSQDAKSQEFLTWAQEKSGAVSASYKAAAIRAFYFALALDLDLALALDLDRALARNPDLALDLDRARVLDRALDHALDPDLALARTLDHALDPDLALARTLAHAHDLDPDLDLDPTLLNQVQQLMTQLLKNFSEQNWEFRRWWARNGQAWIEELRQVMIEHRNIGHDWQFTTAQKQTLQHYYDANKFLVELLEQGGAVSKSVRQEIEDNLLLPIAELKRRLPDLYS